MKKILSMACAVAVAIAAFGMVVTAAPSPTKEVPTVQTEGLTAKSSDAAMDEWKAEIKDEKTITLLEQMAANSISAKDALTQMFGNASAVKTTDGKTVDMSGFSMLVAPFDLSAAEGATNVTATFTSTKVVGLSDANKVTVLHYNEVAGAWEAITPSKVDYKTGAITATFANLSPVAVVYQPTAGDGSVAAPKTGDNNLMMVYAVVAVAAVAAVVVINRKRRQA